jgi:sporulation protein YabP
VTQQPGAGKASSGHRLVIENREQCTVTGVLRVASFDDHSIVLETDLGALTLQGTDLEIKQLDVDAGTFSVQGLVSSVQYAAGGGQAGTRGRRGVRGLFR